MPNYRKIIVTGEHSEGHDRYPEADREGTPLLWQEVPVLKFEALPLPQGWMDQMAAKPYEWIIFTSQRAVAFWTQALVEAGIDFPIETQVACIGSATAKSASDDGFTPDFYPTEPGTEKFIEEFDALIMNNLAKPTVLIPMAEKGRRTIAEHLISRGCEVTILPTYRTSPREDISRNLSQKDLDEAEMVLFTSPSSVDALVASFQIPAAMRLASVGRFTADHLEKLGYSEIILLPEGDFGRVGELLC